MLNKNKGFALPLFLVLMMTLSIMVVSTVCLTTSSFKDVGLRTEKQSARYISEAGIYKAIWYLTTPVAEGGKGINWRTSGVTEEFGGGHYIIIIENYPIEDYPVSVKITSKGYYRTNEYTSKILGYQDFADDFIKYTLFSAVDFQMDSPSEISGNLFADGNVAVPAGSKVVSGVVAVTPGHTVTGGGESTSKKNWATFRQLRSTPIIMISRSRSPKPGGLRSCRDIRPSRISPSTGRAFT